MKIICRPPLLLSAQTVLLRLLLADSTTETEIKILVPRLQIPHPNADVCLQRLKQDQLQHVNVVIVSVVVC